MLLSCWLYRCLCLCIKPSSDLFFALSCIYTKDSIQCVEDCCILHRINNRQIAPMQLMLDVAYIGVYSWVQYYASFITNHWGVWPSWDMPVCNGEITLDRERIMNPCFKCCLHMCRNIFAQFICGGIWRELCVYIGTTLFAAGRVRPSIQYTCDASK